MNKLFLMAAVVLLICSCGNPVNHDKEVNYYVTFATEMRKTTATVNAFWTQLVEAAQAAQQNPDKKLDSAYIAGLNKSYETSTQALSTAINDLSAVEEIDKEINLKEKTLADVKSTKELQESALPLVIQALANGLGKLTDEQRQAFEKFKMRGQELRKTSAELKKLAQQFQSKHNITDEELTAHGL